MADLISVPFQNNFNFNTGSKDATVYILNVQPVIPIKLTEDWNLITRTIMPIINQPSLFPGRASSRRARSGWGTSTPRCSSRRRKPGKFIWGLGPTFTIADGHRLASWATGSSPWGPPAWRSCMHGPWVFGALANQQWSVAGWGDRT